PICEDHPHQPDPFPYRGHRRTLLSRSGYSVGGRPPANGLAHPSPPDGAQWCAGVPERRCTCAQVRLCAGAPMRLGAGTSVRSCPRTVVPGCTSHRCGVPLLRCTDALARTASAARVRSWACSCFPSRPPGRPRQNGFGNLWWTSPPSPLSLVDKVSHLDKAAKKRDGWDPGRVCVAGYCRAKAGFYLGCKGPLTYTM